MTALEGVAAYLTIGAVAGVAAAFVSVRDDLIHGQPVNRGAAVMLLILITFTWPTALLAVIFAAVARPIAAAFMAAVRLTLPRDKP